MQYKLSDAWQKITETTGTLYSTEEKNGSGFILSPMIPFPFKGSIYARATNGFADLNVVAVTLPTS